MWLIALLIFLFENAEIGLSAITNFKLNRLDAAVVLQLVKKKNLNDVKQQQIASLTS